MKFVNNLILRVCVSLCSRELIFLFKKCISWEYLRHVHHVKRCTSICLWIHQGGWLCFRPDGLHACIFTSRVSVHRSASMRELPLSTTITYPSRTPPEIRKQLILYSYDLNKKYLRSPIYKENFEYDFNVRLNVNPRLADCNIWNHEYMLALPTSIYKGYQFKKKL